MKIETKQIKTITLLKDFLSYFENENNAFYCDGYAYHAKAGVLMRTPLQLVASLKCPTAARQDECTATKCSNLELIEVIRLAKLWAECAEETLKEDCK